MTKCAAQSTKKSIIINRTLYGVFVALSMYHLFVRRDLVDAMSNLGFALVFDPFDQGIRWNNRPRYQRAWLLVHVATVFLILGVWLYCR